MKNHFIRPACSLSLVLFFLMACSQKEEGYTWDDLYQPGSTPISANESAILQIEFPPIVQDDGRENDNRALIIVDSSLSNLEVWMDGFVMSEEWANSWNSDSVSMNHLIQQLLKQNNQSISWCQYDFGLKWDYYLMPEDYLMENWEDETEKKQAFEEFYPNNAYALARMVFNEDSTQALFARYSYANMSADISEQLDLKLFEKSNGKWKESKLWIFWDKIVPILEGE